MEGLSAGLTTMMVLFATPHSQTTMQEIEEGQYTVIQITMSLLPTQHLQTTPQKKEELFNGQITLIALLTT